MSTKKAPCTNTALIILEKSIPLFAKSGFTGVSMRDIAKTVGISIAALYHHYPDKKSMYIAAMSHAFADMSTSMHSALEIKGAAEERLTNFITSFTQQMADSPDFRALLQRELLDGDDERLKLLATKVFVEPFKALIDLAHDLYLDCDAHLLAISMTGLVLFHFQTAPIRQFLPGGRPEHDDPEIIARHVLMLVSGVFNNVQQETEY